MIRYKQYFIILELKVIDLNSDTLCEIEKKH